MSKLQQRYKTAVGILFALSALVLCFGCSSAGKTTFNLPANSAEISLKQFAQQAGVEIVFDSKIVAGVQTNAVYGTMEPKEALQAMLKGTGLGVTVDLSSGAFAVVPAQGDARRMAGAKDI